MRIVVIALTVIATLLTGSSKPSYHLIYVHGRIVQEQQNARPQHPQYGYYELEKILEAFRVKGFVVTGGIRPKSASMSDSADQLVTQIRELIKSGVPPDHVTVVGASMGAEITLMASARLQNPDLRFAILGACLTENVRALVAGEGKAPRGHVLSILEASDTPDGPCTPWSDEPASSPQLIAREIMLHTGFNHGFLYRPLPEWVNPVAEFAVSAGGN